MVVIVCVEILMHTEEHTKYHMIEHGQILKKNRKI